MFRFKTAAIVSLISLISPFALANPEATPFGQVVVRDTSDRYETRAPEPWLIPMALLEQSRDQWSREDKALVPEPIYGKFVDIVESVRDRGRSGHCNPSEALGGSHDPTPPGTRYSIKNIAGTQNTVVVAEVVASESAWDVLNIRVTTLVHLKVTRVIRAIDPIAVGDYVTIRRPWGIATVRGVTLCSSPGAQPLDPGRPTQSVPERERQQFLLIGEIARGNKFYMNTGGFGEFQIIEGLVHYPQNYSYYRDQKPEKLGDVVTSILAGNPQ